MPTARAITDSYTAPANAPSRPHRMREIDPDKIERALVAREGGATLRESAAAAGVHVATLCRWVHRHPWLGQALEDAELCARIARRRRRLLEPPRKPSVPWHPACPLCGELAAVVTMEFRVFAFWRCSTWPGCPFASWRPRYPEDCPACGSARFWSCSRKSVGCPDCGRRVYVGRPAR